MERFRNADGSVSLSLGRVPRWSMLLGEWDPLIGEVAIHFGGWHPNEEEPTQEEINVLLEALGVPADAPVALKRRPPAKDPPAWLTFWNLPYPALPGEVRLKVVTPSYGDAIGGVHPLHTESR